MTAEEEDEAEAEAEAGAEAGSWKLQASILYMSEVFGILTLLGGGGYYLLKGVVWHPGKHKAC